MPKPVDHNRNCIVMELVAGSPLLVYFGEGLSGLRSTVTADARTGKESAIIGESRSEKAEKWSKDRQNKSSKKAGKRESKSRVVTTLLLSFFRFLSCCRLYVIYSWWCWMLFPPPPSSLFSALPYFYADVRCQIKEVGDPGSLVQTLMDIAVRLAAHGLIHCDLNEFNVMVGDDGKVTMIDFPQMVSTEHINAEMYFDRDIACIRTFCERRFGFIAEEYPRFADVVREASLDVAVAASGFTRDLQAELERVRGTSFFHSLCHT